MGSKMTIAAGLRSLGIQGGDVLMVHASLKRIGPVVGGARAVVGALCDAVAPSGTLMGSLPEIVDERLSEFLSSHSGQGLDQPSAATYRAIVDLFDREWLSQLNNDFSS
jgi:hypothetical protein